MNNYCQEAISLQMTARYLKLRQVNVGTQVDKLFVLKHSIIKFSYAISTAIYFTHLTHQEQFLLLIDQTGRYWLNGQSPGEMAVLGPPLVTSLSQ